MFFRLLKHACIVKNITFCIIILYLVGVISNEFIFISALLNASHWVIFYYLINNISLLVFIGLFFIL